MPAGIMLMGITFNLLNGYMQGEWIFYLAPQDMYTKSWLHSPQFIVGTILFFTGMAINIQSDHIVRHLRKPGDTNHYLPKKGLFKYVTSANYFGEIVRICNPDLECKRSCFRLVDICKPCTSRKHHLS